MKGRFFLDTNLLVYADDAAAGPKQEIAQRIVLQALTDRIGVISTQVIQEYFVVATRKLGLSPLSVRQRISVYGKLEVVVIRPELILDAIDLLRLHQINFWDALILQSAKAAGCTRLLTEDLSSGQAYSGVQVENPFGAI